MANEKQPINHKGDWCIISSKFCQEGYCNECQIYRDWQKKWEEKLQK